MNKIFLFFVLLSFLAFSAVADMVPHGFKGISYCFVLEDQEKYSEYVFLLYGEPLVHGGIINLGECIQFYKYTQPHIYAIKAENFSPEELERLIDNLRNTGREGELQLNDYFDDNIEMIKSNFYLSVYGAGTISKYEPLTSVQEYIKIAEINSQSLILIKDKVIFSYEDGSSETKRFLAQDIFPEPSKSSILPWWTDTALFISLFVLIILAVIMFIIILIKRIRRR